MKHICEIVTFRSILSLKWICCLNLFIISCFIIRQHGLLLRHQGNNNGKNRTTAAGLVSRSSGWGKLRNSGVENTGTANQYSGSSSSSSRINNLFGSGLVNFLGALNFHSKKWTPSTSSSTAATALAQQLRIKLYLANITEIQEIILRRQRLKLEDELRGYYSSSSNYLHKKKEPIRNLIVTSWRSGSNFLSSVLHQVPGTFINAEPFNHHGWTQFRNGSLAEKSIRELRDLLRCDYTNLHEYIEYAKNDTWIFATNPHLGQYCYHYIKDELCGNANFFSKMCKLFPHQTTKTVRLRLKLVQSILEDPKLNVRVIYLIRDPRGTLQSRVNNFCAGNPECDSPKILCTDLEDDYYTAKKFLRRYPQQFMAIRYEDLALNPHAAVKQIYKFLKLNYNTAIEQYLTEATTKNVDGLLEVHRVSTQVPFRWVDQLKENYPRLQEVQNACSSALTLWGYKLVKNVHNLGTQSFHPVGSPPWEEMLVVEEVDWSSSTAMIYIVCTVISCLIVLIPYLVLKICISIS